MAPTQLEIFISYSQEDKEYLEKLTEHLSTLEREKGIQIWHNGKIDAGKEPAKEIEKHLNSSHIVLLLISSSFVASQHWVSEVEPALKRYTEEKACVIPVLLRSYDLQSSQQLSGLQALPRDGKAITSRENKDDAFKEVAEEIRKAIENKSDDIRLPQTDKRRFKITWRDVINVLPKSSIPITLVIIILRIIGAFEASEFWFYDQMMMNKGNESQDERLLIIEATANDIEVDKENNKNEPRLDQASLTEKQILNILGKLIEDPGKKPKAIGLDIYRDSKIQNDNHELTKNPDNKQKTIDSDINLNSGTTSKLQKVLTEENNYIFGVCNIGDKSTNNPGVKPPPKFKHERLGFSDVWADDGNIVRRQILFNPIDNATPCKAKNTNSKTKNVDESFPLVLAKHYFKDQPSLQKTLSQKTCSFLPIGDVFLSNNEGYRGGYSMHTDLNEGCQVLLNYRRVCLQGNCSIENVAQKVNVEDFLKENFVRNNQEFKDFSKRIVLIGITETTSNIDMWTTPFSSGNKKQIPGVILQAQMLSQILSAVEGDPNKGKRPILQVLPLWQDMGWIFLWSLVGGIVAQKYYRIKTLIISGTIAFIGLLIICYLMFTYKFIWIPFIPSLLGFLCTMVALHSMKSKSQK